MKKEIFIILDNVRSRENVGSIFRTADAARVSKIYLCGITPVPKLDDYGLRITNLKNNAQSEMRNRVIDKISKTALGAEKWVPWEYRPQTYRCLLKIKNQNSKIKIVGLEQTKTSQNIFTFKPQFPVALVVGNEVKGISPKILKYCDKKIAIPMYGKKESLNVSVATGIAVYEILRKV